MLKRLSADTDGKDWDEFLQYLSYAYRSSIHENLGFSPFELLFGCDVQGPLSLVYREMLGKDEVESNICEFVLNLKDKLIQVTEIKLQQETSRKSKKKKWYDKKSRDRQFVPDDEVLALLPTSGNKNMSSWQGPYKIVEKMAT